MGKHSSGNNRDTTKKVEEQTQPTTAATPTSTTEEPKVDVVSEQPTEAETTQIPPTVNPDDGGPVPPEIEVTQADPETSEVTPPVSDKAPQNELEAPQVKAVMAHGIRYSSVEAAAQALSVSTEAILARIATSGEEYDSYQYAED